MQPLNDSCEALNSVAIESVHLREMSVAELGTQLMIAWQRLYPPLLAFLMGLEPPQKSTRMGSWKNWPDRERKERTGG